MEDETHPWAVSTVPMLDETRHWAGFTVPMLYRYVLIYGAPVTGFCQKLEQIIVMGRRALGAVTPPYVTPRDYILRFLYGDKCYIDSEYQMAVGYQKGMLFYIVVSMNVDNNKFTSYFESSITLIPIGF